MKTEVKDIAMQLAVSAPTSITAILSKVTITEWVAILFGVLQAVYLVRKWWREETEWGLRLKRWTRGEFTQPAPLRGGDD